MIDPRRTETARLATPLPPAAAGLRLGAARLRGQRAARGRCRPTRPSSPSTPEGVDRLRAAVARDRSDDGARTHRPAGRPMSTTSSPRCAGTSASRPRPAPASRWASPANVTEWLTWALHVIKGSYDRPGGMWFNPDSSAATTGAGWRPARRTRSCATPSPPSRPDLPPAHGRVPERRARRPDRARRGARADRASAATRLSSLPDPERLGRSRSPRSRCWRVLDVVRTETVEPRRTPSAAPTRSSARHPLLPRPVPRRGRLALHAGGRARRRPSTATRWQIFHELGYAARHRGAAGRRRPAPT